MLQKVLDLKDLFFIGLGDIVGAGVFAIFAKVLLYGGANTIPAILFIASISIITGLSYAEIVSMFKSNASEFVLLKETFGKTISSGISYTVLLFELFTASTIIIALSKYIFGNNRKLGVIFSIAIVSIMLYIQYFGIVMSKDIVNTIGIFILTLLISIIVIGTICIRKMGLHGGSTIKDTLHNIAKTPTGIKGFLFSAVFITFLYAGYDTIVKVHDEVDKKTEKKIPLAIVAAILASTFIYIGLTFIATIALPDHEILKGYHPIAVMYRVFSGDVGYNIAYYIGMIIMLGTAFIVLLGANRFMYGLSKEETLPPILKKLSKYDTPTYSILLSLVICVAIVAIDNEKLALVWSDIFQIVMLIAINIGLVWYRYHNPQKEGFKMPGYVGNIAVPPILAAIAFVVLLGTAFYMLPLMYD